MTPSEAARAVAEDLDLIGTDQADWAARWWYRFAHYLSTPTLVEDRPVMTACRYCGRTGRSSLFIRMHDGTYRCDDAPACQRRIRKQQCV